MAEQQPSVLTPEEPAEERLVDKWRRREAARQAAKHQAAESSASEPTPKPVITMYVRRGESSDPKIKIRTISLHPIPDKVNMDDLLDIGFAYDGDTVSLSVDPYTTASFGKGPWPIGTRGKPDVRSSGDNASILEPWTLTKALNNVQRVLVEWLRNLGYEVKIA